MTRDAALKAFQTRTLILLISKTPRRGSNIPLGRTSWAYPEGIADSDWQSAASSSGIQSDYLVAQDYWFVIPAGATIRGVQLDVLHWTNHASVDGAVRVVKTAIGSTDRSSTVSWGGAYYSPEHFVYGGATDLWGETWTPADIESSTFGFAIAAMTTTLGVPSSFFVSDMKATVYLSCP